MINIHFSLQLVDSGTDSIDLTWPFGALFSFRSLKSGHRFGGWLKTVHKRFESPVVDKINVRLLAIVHANYLSTGPVEQVAIDRIDLSFGPLATQTTCEYGKPDQVGSTVCVAFAWREYFNVADASASDSYFNCHHISIVIEIGSKLFKPIGQSKRKKIGLKFRVQNKEYNFEYKRQSSLF